MKNLYDGVQEAMRFLDPDSLNTDLDVVFYGHDISDYDKSASEIVLRVKAASVVKLPEKTNFVLLGNIHFQIIDIQEIGEYYHLHVKKFE